ncbi:hypothetical protein E2562_027166 [Oryza meyeriana var. granulata]|uniref:Uncharacterized protein n=1 Tax=Oryza meyeriana var. granulata TaxID=110450 RepID=A0A6G1EQ26_9ORYZ|nr:hypothetical protein E2562_027166 [Oryza meyeriana var. granulata]
MTTGENDGLGYSQKMNHSSGEIHDSWPIGATSKLARLISSLYTDTSSNSSYKSRDGTSSCPNQYVSWIGSRRARSWRAAVAQAPVRQQEHRRTASSCQGRSGAQQAGRRDSSDTKELDLR